jgi:hypothetical protein
MTTGEILSVDADFVGYYLFVMREQMKKVLGQAAVSNA